MYSRGKFPIAERGGTPIIIQNPVFSLTIVDIKEKRLKQERSKEGHKENYYRKKQMRMNLVRVGLTDSFSSHLCSCSFLGKLDKLAHFPLISPQWKCPKTFKIKLGNSGRMHDIFLEGIAHIWPTPPWMDLMLFKTCYVSFRQGCTCNPTKYIWGGHVVFQYRPIVPICR